MSAATAISPALSPDDAQFLAQHWVPGACCRVPDLTLPGAAWVGLSRAVDAARPLVLVTDGTRSMEELYGNMQALAQGHAIELRLLPPRETAPLSTSFNLERERERLELFMDDSWLKEPYVLVTCIQALMQKTVKPARLRQQTIRLKLREEVDLEKLTAQLDQMGYRFHYEVTERGEASLRGGILDVWPVTEELPLRFELFGPVLESIRVFEPLEQRSVEKLQQAELPPLSSDMDLAAEAEGQDVFMLFEEAAWLLLELGRIRDHASMFAESLSNEEKDRHVPYADIERRWETGGHGGVLMVDPQVVADAACRILDIEPAPSVARLTAADHQPDVIEKERLALIESAVEKKRDGWEVHAFFASPGSHERFHEQYADVKGIAGLQTHDGFLSEGFALPGARLLLLSEADIWGYRKQRMSHREDSRRRGHRTSYSALQLADWRDVQPGELVVHINHGIGRYMGLYEIQVRDRMQEVLTIEYKDDAKLYVPVTQAHLVSRYIGVGKKRPSLHRLADKRWRREKDAALKAVADMAASMLDTQAARETEQGIAFAKDTHWQHEFEMTFPFEETEDQKRAIAEVKEDMERIRSMDRLVCGDVGYGKTEVAMRAAFKAVMDGKQVAMLVPTTVLAQQHFNTFCERMSAFPVRIEMLSRFRTKAQQAETVKAVRGGAVDIVIGTHRLLQEDVAFDDLGLVIIDEEQRFGVMHKERLKELSRLVDVLTLTATPIPRTLYMSLMGARDISTIQTPPQERLPVETLVMPYSDDVVRNAVIRELNREGQVFYLYNRVKTIHKVQQKLARLVPEARVAVAHGQMAERQLEQVMQQFINGEYDVLLCTTIIESGVDIPNVNTILIDRADRFGLSDLYQLRGRVGRYKHKAYAYFLLPKHGQMYATARKRMRAMKQYSSLGAGFKLALKDLEIRGAGNLLGAQQSGHITAVGFDLYCQFLKRAVAGVKGEPLPPIIDVELKLDFLDYHTGEQEEGGHAGIPFTYIEEENLRLQAYRKLSTCSTMKELAEVRASFEDRYGPPPGPVQRLLMTAELRITAAMHRIERIETRGERVLLTRGGELIMRDRRQPRLPEGSAHVKLQGLIDIVKEWGR